MGAKLSNNNSAAIKLHKNNNNIYGCGRSSSGKKFGAFCCYSMKMVLIWSLVLIVYCPAALTRAQETEKSGAASSNGSANKENISLLTSTSDSVITKRARKKIRPTVFPTVSTSTVKSLTTTLALPVDELSSTYPSRSKLIIDNQTDRSLISVPLFNTSGRPVALHVDSVFPRAQTVPVGGSNPAQRDPKVADASHSAMAALDTGDDKERINGNNSSFFVAGPEFDITPHPQYPHTVLRISYSKSAGDLYQEMRVNYSDLSYGTVPGTPPHSPPGSYKLSGDNPFHLFDLSPGHEYRFEIFGTPKEDPDNQELLYSDVAMTDPKTPTFEEPPQTGSDSITIKGEKAPDSLQDYFLVEYTQLDGIGNKFEPLNVTDLPEQKKVELYVGNLNPGRSYNVSIKAFRLGKSSKPWTAIVTTKPLKPEKPSVTNLDSTTLTLNWKAPENSGIDRYHVTYHPSKGLPSGTMDANNISETKAVLSVGLFPGETYQFAIYTLKANEASQPALLEVTMKPMPPISLDIDPDYSEKQFRLKLNLHSVNVSIVDSCYLQYLSESEPESSTQNASLSVLDKKDHRSCEILLDLVPGARYQFRAWTLSDKTPSAMFANITAVRPAFNQNLFGVQVHSGHNWLEVQWRQDYAEMLEEVWPALVGNDSDLTAKISGKSMDQPKMKSGKPGESIIFDDELYSGSCYKILLYTATSSGIVSENRTEFFVRTKPPHAKITLREVGEEAANLLVRLIDGGADEGSSPMENNPTETDDETRRYTDENVAREPTKIDENCVLIFLAKNNNGTVVGNRTLLSLKSGIGSEISVGLGNLKPYSKYHCTAFIKCGGLAGDTDQCDPTEVPLTPFSFETAEGRPGPVRGLRITAENPFTARVKWESPERPNGVVSSYLVMVIPELASRLRAKSIDPKIIKHPSQLSLSYVEYPWNITVAGDQTEVTVANLTGGLRYRFDVRALTSAGVGESAIAGSTGAEGTTNYPERGPYDSTLRMPVWSPPKPTGRPQVLVNTIRATDFSIWFNLSSLSTKHGLLQKYSLIVGEGPHLSRSNTVEDADRMMNWYDVHKMEYWPPYTAVEKPLHRRKEMEARAVTEVIGVDETCLMLENQRQDTGVLELCNGPLKAGRVYRVKLRVFSSPDKWTDSDWSDIVETESSRSGQTAVIAGIIISLMVLLVLILAVLVFLKRGRGDRLCPPTFGETSASSILAKLGWKDRSSGSPSNSFSVSPYFGNADLDATQGVRGHQRPLRERTGADGRLERLGGGGGLSRFSLPPVHTIIPGAKTEKSRPVRKRDFGEHVRLMSADSDFRFSEEYEDLKQVGKNISCSAADLPCNRNKNRFTNILPFDHSRVKLIPVDDEEGSDFVNANYIPGYNSPREFIAAQGPLPSTRDDFWRMIWEQQCPAVINLTRCVEKGREKCDQYWPTDKDPVTYGDIEVALMNETRHPDWIMRELKMINLSEPSSHPHYTKHYHYVSWPDFGVPERPQVLVQFVRSFRAKVPPDSGSKPTIVHCSAGVGRSGTFITIDYLMQSILREDTIDIYGIVYRMRKERVWMVQTEQQYICIHHAVLCVLEGRENDEPTPSYPLAVAPPVVLPHSQGGYRAMPTLAIPRPISPRGSPRVEVHQNPAFEDDEGIAESGV